MTDDPTTTADGTETGRTDSDSGNRSDADDRNQWTAREEFDDPDRMEELEETNAELRERVAELESIVADIAPGTGTTDRPRAEQVDDEGGTDSEAKPVLPSGGQPQKVVGKFENPNGGVGVYGHNTATSGTTYGVWGEVNSPDGYGIATPDAARIEGAIDTNETDFVVEAGTQSTDHAQNVVLGHASNAGGAVGATISGGGYDDGSTDQSNEVTARYGTVGGGGNNTASGDVATVGGGAGNTASGNYGTVGGGIDNTASGDYSFAAGRNAEAPNDGSMAFGDSSSATVSTDRADQALFQGELATNGELRVDADNDASFQYLRFGDQTGANGPRIYYSSSGNAIVFGGVGRVDLDHLEVDYGLTVDDSTPQTTAGPVAKGYVNADASLANGTNVNSVSWSSYSNWYDIEIEENTTAPEDYATTVTPEDSAVAARASLTGADNLLIQFADGNQHEFQFVTHKLTSGSTQLSSSAMSSGDAESDEEEAPADT